MHGLSVHVADYAVLYAQCMQRFPDIALQLAKPEMFLTSTSPAFQTPPQRSWPQPPTASSAVSARPAPTRQLLAHHPALASPSAEAEAFFCTHSSRQPCYNPERAHTPNERPAHRKQRQPRLEARQSIHGLQPIQTARPTLHPLYRPHPLAPSPSSVLHHHMQCSVSKPSGEKYISLTQ
jgi:hypothetical protein